MTLQKTDPLPIQASRRLYGLLLKAYPAAFRVEYGRHMAQVFNDACLHSHHRSGHAGLLALWELTIFDWFKTVIEEQLNRATEMTRSKWVHLCGWAMMAGAVTLQLGFMIDANRIRVSMYRIFGPPVSRAEYDQYVNIANQLEGVPTMIGILLFVLSVTGLRQRYGDQLGEKWRAGFAICTTGGVLTGAGALGLPFQNADWTVFAIGLCLMFGSLAIFGMVAMRAGLLPKWSGVPLLACFWIPLSLVVSLVYEWATGGQSLELPRVLDWIFMTLSFVSLLLLGFEIQRVSMAGDHARRSSVFG